MISARRRSNTRRLILIGLFVSLIVHLFGGATWDALARLFDRLTPPPKWASLQSEPSHPTPIILERPQQPTRVVPHTAPPPPTVVRQPQPVPVPQTVPHELVHVTIHAPHREPPVQGPGATPVQAPVRPGAPPKPQSHPYYSDDQIAQMNDAFAKTIAASTKTVAEANSEMARPVETMKHYEMHFAGIHEGLNPGDGTIRPVKSWKVGDQDYYYVHYIYMYGDGHIEEADVPWPVHYPAGDDPFARGDKRIPIQNPPPDYTPDHQLPPILQAFFGGPNPFTQQTQEQ